MYVFLMIPPYILDGFTNENNVKSEYYKHFNQNNSYSEIELQRNTSFIFEKIICLPMTQD